MLVPLAPCRSTAAGGTLCRHLSSKWLAAATACSAGERTAQQGRGVAGVAQAGAPACPQPVHAWLRARRGSAAWRAELSAGALLPAGRTMGGASRMTSPRPSTSCTPAASSTSTSSRQTSYVSARQEGYRLLPVQRGAWARRRLGSGPGQSRAARTAGGGRLPGCASGCTGEPDAAAWRARRVGQPCAAALCAASRLRARCSLASTSIAKP